MPSDTVPSDSVLSGIACFAIFDFDFVFSVGGFCVGIYRTLVKQRLSPGVAVASSAKAERVSNVAQSSRIEAAQCNSTFSH
jgi:hypothetical protein